MDATPVSRDSLFLAAIAEALLMNSQAGIVVYEGRTGDCLLANQALADLTGGSVDGLRHQNFRGLRSFHEAHVDDVLELVLTDGTPRRHTATMLTSFGHLISFDYYASSFLFGGTPYLVLVISDITLRVQAEKALALREEALRTLVDTVPICMVRYDKELRRIYMNHSWEDASGLFPQDFLGLLAGEYPRDKDLSTPIEYLEKLSTVLRTGRSQKVAFPWRNARLEELYLECTLIPEYDRAGEVAGVLSVASDLTEHRRVETELLRAKNLAEAASAAKSQFLANMSHEIRTPLNGISGMLQLLGYTRLDQEQQEYLQAARESSNRLTRLLADILDFSAAVSGRLLLQEGRMEIARLKQVLLAAFQGTALDKGLTLELDIDPRMPSVVLGDAQRLEQVLFHLLDNAVKFTDSGGVRLELSPIRVGEDAVQALFVVRDTGIGIPDEHLDVIFKPFVQADGSATRKFQGAGIGLSIIANLVTLMHGTLTIESEEEVGTAVHVSVPLRLPAEATPAAGQPGTPDPQKPGPRNPVS